MICTIEELVNMNTTVTCSHSAQEYLILPCLHSSCRICMLEASVDQQVICNACHLEIPVQQLDQLPLDHIRLDQEELYKLKNRQVYCSVCETQNATVYSTSLCKFYCEDHQKDGSGIFNKNEWKTIEAVIVEKEKKFSVPTGCAIEKDTSQIYQDMRSKICCATEKTAHSIAELSGELDKLHNLQKLTDDTCEKTNESINSEFDRLIGVLNDRRRQLLQQVQDHCFQKSNSVQLEGQMLEEVISRFVQSIDFANHVLQYNDQAGLVQVAPLISDRLDSLVDVHYKVKEKPLRLSFSFDDTQLKQDIGRIGSIQLDSKPETTSPLMTNTTDLDIKEAYKQKVIQLTNQLKKSEESRKESEFTFKSSLEAMTEEYTKLQNQTEMIKKEKDQELNSIRKNLKKLAKKMQKSKKLGSTNSQTDDLMKRLKQLVDSMPPGST